MDGLLSGCTARPHKRRFDRGTCSNVSIERADDSKKSRRISARIRQAAARVSDVPSQHLPARPPPSAPAARSAPPDASDQFSLCLARAPRPRRKSRQCRPIGSLRRGRPAWAGALRPARACIRRPHRKLGPRPESRRRRAKRPEGPAHRPPPGPQTWIFGAAKSSYRLYAVRPPVGTGTDRRMVTSMQFYD